MRMSDELTDSRWGASARPVINKEKPMTSEPIRDPRGDHLLTPQNCALVIIDYQPT
jgi:hypothetical protein